MNARQKRKSKRQSQAAPVVEAQAPPAPKAERIGGEDLIEPVFFKQGPTRKEDEEDVFDPVNFRRVENKWWLDWLFPDGVIPYFITAFVVCHVAWTIGLFIRLAANNFDDAGRHALEFLQSREWQMQPLLLFLHFTTLRLFKGIYSRNFEKAFGHLNISQPDVIKLRDWIFGRRVNLGAVVIALPFLAYKLFVYLPSDRFFTDFRVDWWGMEARYLFAIWCVEWMIFGYYLYLLLVGALITRHVLKNHQFKESVDLVLSERHYSPLFNCTARAGTLVFFFALVHAAYLTYAGAEIADFIGLSVLGLLLMVSFGITWAAVRKSLSTGVKEAVESLERSYRNSRGRLQKMPEVPGIEDDVQRIQTQMKMSLALQQLEYLQTKYEQVGRREMLGMFFRMMAPVGTVLARVIRWGSLLAALGIGSAALFSERDKLKPTTTNKEPASNSSAR